MQSDGRGIRAAMRAPRRFSDQLAEIRERGRGQIKEERREMTGASPVETAMRNCARDEGGPLRVR